MRIASVEVVPYALPFREPYVTAAGRLDRREMALLRLTSSEGLVGLGEAVPLQADDVEPCQLGAIALRRYTPLGRIGADHPARDDALDQQSAADERSIEPMTAYSIAARGYTSTAGPR